MYPLSFWMLLSHSILAFLGPWRHAQREKARWQTREEVLLRTCVGVQTSVSVGAAVSFGPHTRNFRDEVRRLLAADAAVVVAEGAALTEFVRQCLETEGFSAALGGRAAALVASQRGSTAATAAVILRRLPAMRP